MNKQLDRKSKNTFLTAMDDVIRETKNAKATCQIIEQQQRQRQQRILLFSSQIQLAFLKCPLYRCRVLIYSLFPPFF